MQKSKIILGLATLLLLGSCSKGGESLTEQTKEDPVDNTTEKTEKPKSNKVFSKVNMTDFVLSLDNVSSIGITKKEIVKKVYNGDEEELDEKNYLIDEEEENIEIEDNGTALSQDQLESQVNKCYVCGDYTFLQFIPNVAESGNYYFAEPNGEQTNSLRYNDETPNMEYITVRPEEEDLTYDVDGIADFDKSGYSTTELTQSFIVNNENGNMYLIDKDYPVSKIVDNMVLINGNYNDYSINDDEELVFAPLYTSENNISVLGVFGSGDYHYVWNKEYNFTDSENHTIYYTGKDNAYGYGKDSEGKVYRAKYTNSIMTDFEKLEGDSWVKVSDFDLTKIISGSIKTDKEYAKIINNSYIECEPQPSLYRSIFYKTDFASGTKVEYNFRPFEYMYNLYTKSEVLVKREQSGNELVFTYFDITFENQANWEKYKKESYTNAYEISFAKATDLTEFQRLSIPEGAVISEVSNGFEVKTFNSKETYTIIKDNNLPKVVKLSDVVVPEQVKIKLQPIR